MIADQSRYSPYRFRKEDAYRFAREQGIRTKERGRELVFEHCPYCHGGRSHEKETFAINLETGAHNCKRQGCAVTGNVISLHKDFGFSLGSEVDAYFDGNHTKYKPFKAKVGSITPRPSALQYLQTRGISPEIAARYEITSHKDRPEILCFPFYDTNGVLWFIKYRNTVHVKGKGAKEWSEAGRKPILFGMQCCEFEKDGDKPLTLVMTEGQIDSLTLAECGIKNAVSVPNGCKGFTWAPHCWNFLGRFDELIVFGDYENGRITLLQEMVERFHGRVKHIRPEDYKDCKDANDLYRKYGKKAIVDAVKNAVAVPVRHVKNLADVQSVNLSELECISTGFAKLDRVINSFYFGTLIILTGKRGEGKSTLASQFAVNALDQGYFVFCYSGELSDWNVKIWSELQMAGRKNILKIEGPNRTIDYQLKGGIEQQLESWYSGRMWIFDNNPFVNPETGEVEAGDVLKVMEETIQQYGVRFAVLDNLMTAIDLDDGRDLYVAQTGFVRRLTVIAKRYNVIILLVVHPRKESSASQGFTNDDVAGSSNITNLADVILKYSRPPKPPSKGKDDEEDEYDPDTMDRIISVHKNRYNGRILSKGFKAYFEPESRRISDTYGSFDWSYGWESDSDGFTDVTDDDLKMLPF